MTLRTHVELTIVWESLSGSYEGSQYQGQPKHVVVTLTFFAFIPVMQHDLICFETHDYWLNESTQQKSQNGVD
ncbi:hypothetical protein J1614_003672 [Plenodomus biglobosus]|nr:hypothetical protein J1614_003672 [Plenodomus biglobosus]